MMTLTIAGQNRVMILDLVRELQEAKERIAILEKEVHGYHITFKEGCELDADKVYKWKR